MSNNPLIVLTICALLNLCVFTHVDAQGIDNNSAFVSGSHSVGVDKIKELLTNLNGKLKLNLFDHFHDGEKDKTGKRQQDANAEQDTDRYRFEFDLNLDITGNISDSTSYFMVPRLRFDNVNWASGVIDELNETDRDRFIFNFDEVYLTHRSDRVEISFGKKIYEWGTSDGYNPTDNINPVDSTDVPTIEKIGVPSAYFDYAHDLFNLELVFVPLFSPSRLPAPNNRWKGAAKDSNEGQGNSSGFSKDDLDVRSGGVVFPVDDIIDNSQFAVRISTSTLLEGWDFSLSYYDGLAPIGVTRSELDRSSTPPVAVVTRVFPHCREFGADFSTTFDKLEVHGEAAAHLTDGDKMDDDYMEYVVGINYTFDEMPFEFLEKITTVVEFAGEAIFDEKRSDKFSGSGDYFRPFKNSVLSDIEFKFSEDTKFKVSGSINIEHSDRDSYIRPLFSHKLYDSTKCELGFDIFSGPKDTFFGKWRQNDRFFLTFTQYF